MKKVILAMILTMSMGVAQAFPVIGLAFIAATVANDAERGETSATLQQTVTAAHASNPDGYTFDLTVYEYNQNKTAYVLK